MSVPSRLFLSDLHLDDPDSDAFRAFDALMAGACGRFAEIYLLGDLCEIWVGDDDDGPLARAVVASLARTAATSRVLVMPGNRDFLFGARFEHDSGARLIEDPHLLDDGILIAHGDAFCTADRDYQAVRRKLRSAAWQRTVLDQPLDQRRSMAAAMRANSRAANANKPENIMDVSAEDVACTAQNYRARVLIHGHTHRPGIHVEPWGRRYVLGAWERCGWRVEQHGPSLKLVCFSLSAS